MYVPTKGTYKYVVINEEKSSNTIDSIISPYKNVIEKEMNMEIGYSKSHLTKQGHESALGNFFCDAMKWAYDSIRKEKTNCLVLMNHGGMRTSLYQGTVKVSNMFELMPFENELNAITISGNQLLEIVEAIKIKQHPYFGFKLISDNKNKNEIFLLNGNPMKVDSNYCLITSDYLINGGDGFKFGENNKTVIHLNFLLRDALIRYTQHVTFIGDSIKAYKDGRYHVE